MALSGLSDLSGALSGASTTAASAATTAASTVAASTPSWLTGSLAQITLIILGLLLIAAGIFSFDKTKELVISGAKKGAELAAT